MKHELILTEGQWALLKLLVDEQIATTKEEIEDDEPVFGWDPETGIEENLSEQTLLDLQDMYNKIPNYGLYAMTGGEKDGNEENR